MTDEFETGFDAKPVAEPPLLTTQDIASPVWAKLKKHMEAKLERARRLNDTDKDPTATANLRGAIATLKNLLALETAPAMGADEEQGA